jgi:hypothetical protein
MSRRGRVSFGGSPLPVRYDDGEVSFTIPPLSPSSLPSSSGTGISLPIRRRRPSPAVSAVSAQPSDEELRTPASFTVAGDGSPIAGAAASITADESSFAVAQLPSLPPSNRMSSPGRWRELERRSATIKLGSFTGTNVPLATHLAKLQNCAAYYGWSAPERVCHLKASLEGNAASLLWELPIDCSEEQLLQLLQTRFGDREQVERFRFELKTRRRRRGESLQALHQDVCRLLTLSYPGETGSLSKIVARDAFLDSLGDPDMRIRILERGATSIEEAFSIAARYESYLAGSADLMSSEEGGRRRVRAVKQPSDAAPVDDAWRSQMEKSMRT